MNLWRQKRVRLVPCAAGARTVNSEPTQSAWQGTGDPGWGPFIRTRNQYPTMAQEDDSPPEILAMASARRDTKIQ
jgi:hypothetical protein